MNSLNKKLVTLIVMCFAFISNVFAANEGRYYSMEDNHNTSGSLFFYLCCAVAFAIWLIHNIWEHKKEERAEEENYTSYTTKETVQPKRKGRTLCPECKGNGWVLGEEYIYGLSDLTCPHCQGFGVVITRENERLIKRLLEIKQEKRSYADKEYKKYKKADDYKEEKIRQAKNKKFKRMEELRKEQCKWNEEQRINKEQGKPYFDITTFVKEVTTPNSDGICLWSNNKIYNTLRTEITNELDRCPQCKVCHGKDKSCKSCLGTGKELHPYLLYLRDKMKIYKKGFHLYVSDVYKIENDFNEEKRLAAASTGSTRNLLEYLTTDNAEERNLKCELVKYAPCPFCDGKGRFETVQMFMPDSEYHTYIKQKCRKCNGTSFINI